MTVATAPASADSISVSHCAHGRVFLHLHDKSGEVFAVASMDIQTAADVLDDFADACACALEIIKGGQAQPEPEMH